MAALLAVLPTVAEGASISYAIRNYPADQNGANVTGIITTDGTLGVISSNNILSWTWTISAPGVFDYTLNSTDPDAAASGGGIVATVTDLTIPFPFVAPNQFIDGLSLLSDAIPKSKLLWTRSTVSVGDATQRYEGVIIIGSPKVAYTAWSTDNPAMGGTDPWVIASVPEPSNLTLAGVGLMCVIGYAVTRSRRCKGCTPR